MFSAPFSAVEVSLGIRGESTADIGLSFLTEDDFSHSKITGLALKRKPEADSASAVLTGCSGDVSIRMTVPAAPEGIRIRGIAVFVSAPDETECLVYHVSMQEASVGWLSANTPGVAVWAGFPESGGALASRFDPESPPPVSVPEGSFASFLFYPVSSSEASSSPSLVSTRQPRAVFSDGSRRFGFRLSPVVRGVSAFQPSVLKDFSGRISVVSGGAYVKGVFTSVAAEKKGFGVSGREFAAPGDSLLTPIPADPHAVVEWPQAEWRKPEREIFNWDRFPSVIFFDTADYDVQDKYFRRLAFFVEKQGYKGRLLSDGELADKHGFNAHDYRPESLAEFFTAAAAADFPLLDEELELRGVLLQNGIIVAAQDGGFLPGAGAVVSLSRSSSTYLRYFLMAHEGFHALYFIDRDFRRKVSDVYAATNPRALDFLHDYFNVVDSLGYDTSDRYLMENEFMAYLLQNAPANVSRYFSETLAGRYVRNGGDPEKAFYVTRNDAADFVASADELCRYVYDRWGMTGGRIGMMFWDD